MKITAAAHLSYVIAAIILFAVAPSFAQDSTAAKVDEFVNAEMQKTRVPGVSLAVVKNGQIILAKGYGLANVEHQIAVKPETVFQSGSVGKQFTAAAVMLLVEDGKINLDEKISKYLGDVPDAWKNITVRHLLTHTSGLAELPDDVEFLRRDYTEDELLKRAQTIPVAFAPGEKWAYSNMGYATLGILIGKVTGKFYGDFLQERIFKPLGMTTARIINEADIVPNRAAGYRLVKGELKNQEWVSPTMNTTADGSLYLTALDMAKWDAALYGEKLLKKTSLEQMWTPVKLNNGKTSPYGFAWSLNEINKHRIIEHDGQWQGFTSHIARYVDDKLTVIVLNNLAQGRPTRLAHGVAAIYNSELAATSSAPIAENEPTTTARAKELLQQLAENKADRNLFTPQARGLASLEGAKVVTEVLNAVGSGFKFQFVERTASGEFSVHIYRLSGNGKSYLYKLTVTKEGKIAGVELRYESN